MTSLPQVDPASAGFDPERLDRVQRLIESGVEQGLYPGAAYQVLRDGAVVQSGVAGEAASISKELASLLSTLETPPGIPVATVGFNDVENAACLAVSILGVKDRRIRHILEEYRERLCSEADTKARNVEEVAEQILATEPTSRFRVAV